jgi:hypothetical protein
VRLQAAEEADAMTPLQQSTSHASHLPITAQTCFIAEQALFCELLQRPQYYYLNSYSALKLAWNS